MHQPAHPRSGADSREMPNPCAFHERVSARLENTYVLCRWLRTVRPYIQSFSRRTASSYPGGPHQEERSTRASITCRSWSFPNPKHQCLAGREDSPSEFLTPAKQNTATML